jgi:hypothetical protein
MRTIVLLSTLPLLLAIVGCGSSIHDDYGQGPIDKGLYHDAVIENQQRLAGEDHLVRPIYRNPIQSIGKGFDSVIGEPIDRMIDFISHDTPGTAARKMLDENSADNRREGTLRLADFPFARTGPSLKVYAHQATDPDYTVRAAGLRALNRARASGYTTLFSKSLEDDQALVKLEAADALSNIPDPAAARTLIDHLQNDVYRDVRIACADSLRNYHTAEVTQALVGVLGDKDFAVAWQARQSLALLTGQDFRYNQQGWLAYLSNAKTAG